MSKFSVNHRPLLSFLGRLSACTGCGKLYIAYLEAGTGLKLRSASRL